MHIQPEVEIGHSLFFFSLNFVANMLQKYLERDRLKKIERIFNQ